MNEETRNARARAAKARGLEHKKKQAKKAIIFWANPDQIAPYSEGPLAATERFLEQGARERKATVNAKETRNSGGSKPIENVTHRVEAAFFDRLMDLIAETAPNQVAILKLWGTNESYSAIARRLNCSDTWVKRQVEEGICVVMFGMQQWQNNRLRVGS